ncbi:MAG: alcohol dehydrogenase catalytic domain-containing protein, partial [Miltoncostaeaceae bacterium]
MLIKMRRAAINPSDIAFVQGFYGQPRVAGQPAGFEGVGTVVEAGASPEAQALLGKRVALFGGEMYSDYRTVSIFQCI